ncbi:Fic family protein [Colwellia sp. MB3u-70]|uniref:Fic family protein n=1 Tax=unclassified Colwellia TaxID=196834 RepID=UPI0015F7858D|nr:MULTISPECIES: Fic family protein [unclassified Colwellia]MBA6293195.1 Fic family protein [Colwellia sp. MB3u-8]MBA6307033.1 Fic family protein [Colwellia sp. MB3u-70]
MSLPIAELPLPNIEHWETRAVLKKTAIAHRYLAELKGVAESIPNEAILINTLTLQEAKHSSEIENIITTHDELFKAELLTEAVLNPTTKEVQDYAIALRQGFALVRGSGLIRLADILAIQQTLERNKAGLRKLPGTELKNAQTAEVIYTPPQHPQDIERLMDNLVQYINDDELCSADPLVKMAIIHHQFESIHPFYDGNGRTGRIINMLYLVAQDLLDLPVLYLSRYLIETKKDYYQQLQAVRETGEWEPWLLYMLEGIAETAKATIEMIKNIKVLMRNFKQKIRSELPKIYRQELLNNLFNHPYTKIEFVMNDLSITRLTAAKYLEQLVDIGLLHKEKIGRSNYYINQGLVALFIERNKA